jgi:hypothetical protein
VQLRLKGKREYGTERISRRIDSPVLVRATRYRILSKVTIVRTQEIAWKLSRKLRRSTVSSTQLIGDPFEIHAASLVQGHQASVRGRPNRDEGHSNPGQDE